MTQEECATWSARNQEIFAEWIERGAAYARLVRDSGFVANSESLISAHSQAVQAALAGARLVLDLEALPFDDLHSTVKHGDCNGMILRLRRLLGQWMLHGYRKEVRSWT